MSDFFLSTVELHQAADYYKRYFPEEARNSVTIANRAIINEFIVPYTNDLNRWIPMGTPVDWLHNPTHDLEFTWGMNRHWHMIDLGKAYLMKGNPLYVSTFMAHFRSWREQNPVPNQSSYEEAVFFQKPDPWRLLETGLRVQSWISAYKYMEDSPLLDADFQGEFRQGLEEHAEYLTRYLGSTEINHAIMHMQGLFMIAIFHHTHPRAAYWRQVAMERLELCLLHQINSEGIQIELTTHYHNASIEMFGTPYLLGKIAGHSFSAWYGESLRKMGAFTEALIRPDHQSTGIGDSDWISDGRQRLTLLGAILEDDHWIGRGAESSECLWLLGADQYKRCTQLQVASTPSLSSCAFPQTGYYVMRDHHQYLFLDAASMGGAHGHADALNMEWMWGKQLMFTDTGRYTYEEGEWRHYFKSTRAHNTIAVDGLDQTPYVSTQQWGEPEAVATTFRWESNDCYHFVDASHDGYTRLADPVTHRRWIMSGVDVPLLFIVDWLDAAEEHVLEQHFHLHPDARLTWQGKAADERVAQMTYSGTNTTLSMQWITAGIAEHRLQLTEHTGWVSEIYGSKLETTVIQGKATFTGSIGILTLCLPADQQTDRVIQVTSCKLESERMRTEVAYRYGDEGGVIVIDNDTVQWTAEEDSIPSL